MLELLITSSVLILVVLALRLVLRKRVSQRLIYALWLLVAVRLLVPVSFVQSPVSVMNPVSTVVAQAAARADAAVSQAATGQAGQTGGEADPLAAGSNEQPAQTGQTPTANTDPNANNPAAQPESPATDTPTAKLPWWLTALRFVQANNYRVLKLMWLAGTVGVGLWLLTVNIIFRRKLRSTAVPIKVVRCALPLYWCEDIPSPCLVGLFKPAIYITRFSADEQDKLTDVITHELCHWKQWDHVWAMVRCVCVAAYWFNPLVWVAARASRADCELSCDEAVIKKLGEARRIEYGRTLVRMIGARSDYSDRGLAATAMTSDKKGIKARISRIASNPKRSILSVVALALCAVLVCACTFSGAPGGKTDDLPVSDSRLIDPSLVVNPLTGEEGIAPDRVGMKPLGFMVNNLYDSWPQYGIGQADILIEIPVEGGITRMLALYADAREVPLIGSIRSGRIPFLEASAHIDPLITQIGESGGEYPTAEALNVSIIDGNEPSDVSSPVLNSTAFTFKLNGEDYYVPQYDAQGKLLPYETIEVGSECILFDYARSASYPIEHCKFTSAALVNSGTEKGANRPSAVPGTTFFRFGDTGENLWSGAAKHIAFPFTDDFGYADGQFDYDDTSGQYMKSQFGGKPQVDAGNNNAQIGFDNVLVLYAEMVPTTFLLVDSMETGYTTFFDDPNGVMRMVHLTRGGVGYYLRGGQIQEIHWSKPDAKQGFIFTDANGAELIIGTGTSYIAFADQQASDQLVIR